jgi:hypothetical protein
VRLPDTEEASYGPKANLKRAYEWSNQSSERCVARRKTRSYQVSGRSKWPQLLATLPQQPAYSPAHSQYGCE